MNILCIGNSFSVDATRYLHGIAKCGGTTINIVNLYIGGCSLYTHYINMLNDNKAYELHFNGESTGFKTSIKEAISTREWDFVTMQQASHFSINYKTYMPYLKELSAFVKKYAPNAKQVIHQTWAYEQGSQRLCEELGYSDHKDMFKDIKESYKKAADEIGADFIIPSGELLQELIASGIEKVHRDTFHATLGLSRYAIGLLWYEMLTGNSIKDNTFCDFDEEVTKDEISIAKKCVLETVKEYK